jgi:hypothetical protein
MRKSKAAPENATFRPLPVFYVRLQLDNVRPVFLQRTNVSLLGLVQRSKPAY